MKADICTILAPIITILCVYWISPYIAIILSLLCSIGMIWEVIETNQLIPTTVNHNTPAYSQDDRFYRFAEDREAYSQHLQVVDTKSKIKANPPVIQNNITSVFGCLFSGVHGTQTKCGNTSRMPGDPHLCWEHRKEVNSWALNSTMKPYIKRRGFTVIVPPLRHEIDFDTFLRLSAGDRELYLNAHENQMPPNPHNTSYCPAYNTVSIIPKKRTRPSQRPQSGIDMTCIVCMNNTREIIFLPCKHVICCNICATQINKCPQCREIIREKPKIYL